MNIIDRFYTWLDKQMRARRPMAPLRSMPARRASIDTAGQFPTSSWLVQAPDNYESNWQLLTIDSKHLERISPIKLMEVLADLSPEVSKALWDFLRLCNPGWECKALQIDGETEDTRAQAALDSFIELLEDKYGTLDVVLGRIYTGAFLRGGICAELVLDERGRMPVDLATPDPASIRFQEKSDPVLGIVQQPGQWQATGFVVLDRPTFRYIPIDPIFSPYGRPPAAPALFGCLFLLGLLHDLKRVIQQQGYPRLDLSIDLEMLAQLAPQIASSPDAFQAFTDEIIAQVSSAYEGLAPDDAYVHTSNVSVNRPVGAADSGSLAGIDAVIQMLERMAVRGLKTMPLMMGITESTGDIQSNRQYEIFSAGIKSLQHYAETMLGRLFTLSLQAQGIQAKVEFAFAELRASEELRDAQTEQIKIQNAAAKRDQGWTDNNEASEAITGHPAVGEPVRPMQIQAQQPGIGNVDGQTGVSNNKAPLTHVRVKLIPDGADEPLLPVPDTVTISDNDIERAIAEWDRLLPDYAGMLNASVLGATHHDGTDGRYIISRANDASWTYDQATKRYRNTDTGRFIGQRQMVELRDEFIDLKKSAAQQLGERLNSGEISIQQWEIEFRQQVKTTFVDEYVMGKGGRNAMTQSDWAHVGNMVKSQYGYAHAFAQDIAAGNLSTTQIIARSQLYFDSATQAYERGRVASYGALSLPQYPADGQQVCRSNCKCSWNIEETETDWRCTWVLDSAAEHCDTCVSNAIRWAPLVISKGERTIDQVVQHLSTIMNGHH